MKKRVVLAAALAGLMVGVRLVTAAGTGGPSVDPATWGEPRDVPVLCLDEQAGARGLDCRPTVLNDQGDPPFIDMRPVDTDTVDAQGVSEYGSGV